ncbi:MAG TPA: hypothetical protein DCK98_17530 [Chloroflexi bacterium]|nr:hypothetical protein [Chloroflexota bacterium]HAL26002.1 hypothetical protein [Chloroflexota bacterium]
MRRAFLGMSSCGLGAERRGRTERIEHVGDGGRPMKVESVREQLMAEIDRTAERLLATVNSNGHIE